MEDVSLDWLLKPVTVADFVAKYYEQRPLLLQTRAPNYYEQLLTLADFDELLSSAGALDGVRVVHEGRELQFARVSEANRAPSLEEIYAEHRRGATISLTHIHRWSSPLNVLCQRLAESFSANIQVNAYLTPPRSQGLGKHFDTHDVFVLQLHGSKKWMVGGRAVKFPLAHQAYDKDRAAATEYDQEFELTVGDLLYIPRGAVHQAQAIDTTSLHLTVGIVPVVYADIILGNIEAILENRAEFRAALPFGFAREAAARTAAEERVEFLRKEVSRQLSPVSIVDNAVDIVVSARPPDLTGHLLDLEAARSITNTTRVMRRPGLRWEKFGTDSGAAKLKFHGKIVTVPANWTEALEFLESRHTFTADDLPQLSDDARLRFVKRLLEEGFLTLSPS